jgi:protein-S-isoprenylcysteine O-methyltransferase Ste14
MSIMGVGTKIAIPTFIYLAVAAVISWLFSPAFRITDNEGAIIIIGIVMIVAGFSLNLVAAFSMLKAYREERLATSGLYHIFRDPMYVLQIFITLPGLFLLFNSWLVLAGVIPAYIAYRVFVREEHKYLEATFGEEYREYARGVLIKI